nr:hypothetical protein [uncultured Cellulosilyticum sp.]
MKSKREKLPNRVELGPVVDRQKKYAKTIGLTLPEGITKSDAEALINRELDNDEAAVSGLIAYARSKEILCSDYVGNKYLHNLLFDHLEEADKAAFFCFCVYKFFVREAEEAGNLEEDCHSQLFIKFGEEKAKDYYFTASLDEYYGEEIVYFGKCERVVNGKKKTIYGGSVLTRAYKETYAYLKENNLI